ncbi:hypothetical protein [Pontibacter chinhatensis]
MVMLPLLTNTVSNSSVSAENRRTAFGSVVITSSFGSQPNTDSSSNRGSMASRYLKYSYSLFFVESIKAA